MYRKDGYNLWLNYSNSSQHLASQYAKMISPVTVLGNSELLESAISELKTALPVICSSANQKETDLSFQTEGFSGKGLLVCPFSQLPYDIPLSAETVPDNDGFRIVSYSKKTSPFNEKNKSGYQKSESIIITSKTDRGVLYGVFAFIRMLQTGTSLRNLDITEQPKINWRMMNHWDNLDGSIERGYAGKSLWKWEELPHTINSRYTDYARFCASVGINASVVNNVNSDPEILSEKYLQKLAVLAAVFRKYGITLFLSVSFGSPITLGKLNTADPSEETVISWWKNKTDEIYSFIPDFGGFVVKADSEGQLGPYAYGKNHAEGANMLSSVLNPHGGILIWRAFVYGQGENDRAKKAYSDFKPLDGKFAPNAAVQVKNGPIDFQPREPLHPLFGAMDSTSLFMEFQITQEYLGQEKHIVYLAPMWKEYLDWDVNAGEGKKLTVGEIIADGGQHNNSLRAVNSSALSGIAGVTNIGDNTDWCGSLFHPANWYAFGRLAWNYELDAQKIAEEWTLCTWGKNLQLKKTVMFILMNSWKACVDYMTPLGLHHIMKFNHHYGPDPGCIEGTREDWKPPYYHRADRNGLGFDRTKSGSDAVSQYRPGVQKLFETRENCPEEYILWFHHVPWNYRMKSGRTLRDELAYRYRLGVKESKNLCQRWKQLKKLPEEVLSKEQYESVLAKLETQSESAEEWCSVCTSYFLSFENSEKQ